MGFYPSHIDMQQFLFVDMQVGIGRTLYLCGIYPQSCSETFHQCRFTASELAVQEKFIGIFYQLYSEIFHFLLGVYNDRHRDADINSCL